MLLSDKKGIARRRVDPTPMHKVVQHLADDELAIINEISETNGIIRPNGKLDYDGVGRIFQQFYTGNHNQHSEKFQICEKFVDLCARFYPDPPDDSE